MHATLPLMRRSDFPAIARRLDVTGGAPELNPYFRERVLAARALGLMPEIDTAATAADG